MDDTSNRLEELGLSADELNYEERKFLLKTDIGLSEYTIESLKKDLRLMIDALVLELVRLEDIPENTWQNTKLKARLENYTVLLMKINAPAQTKEYLERVLKNSKRR